jgi:hypothetical protein
MGQYLHHNDEEYRLEPAANNYDILYKARQALDTVNKKCIIFCPVIWQWTRLGVGSKGSSS